MICMLLLVSCKTLVAIQVGKFSEHSIKQRQIACIGLQNKRNTAKYLLKIFIVLGYYWDTNTYAEKIHPAVAYI